MIDAIIACSLPENRYNHLLTLGDWTFRISALVHTVTQTVKSYQVSVSQRRQICEAVPIIHLNQYPLELKSTFSRIL